MRHAVVTWPRFRVPCPKKNGLFVSSSVSRFVCIWLLSAWSYELLCNDCLSLRSLQSHSALIQQIPQVDGSRFDVYALTDSVRMF